MVRNTVVGCPLKRVWWGVQDGQVRLVCVALAGVGARGVMQTNSTRELEGQLDDITSESWVVFQPWHLNHGVRIQKVPKKKQWNGWKVEIENHQIHISTGEVHGVLIIQMPSVSLRIAFFTVNYDNPKISQLEWIKELSQETPNIFKKHTKSAITWCEPDLWPSRVKLDIDFGSLYVHLEIKIKLQEVIKIC